jgi:hypothetical protein
MFNGFPAHDDEGYFLITLREYLSGHPLFTQAYPVHGPFYYEVMAGLFKLLGLAPSHDSGRYLTLAVWLLATLMAGLVAFRLTRNSWLGIAAELVTFRALTGLVNEPLHPSGLAALLLVGLVAAAAFRAARPRATAALIGAMVGALCLIKINVGVFAAVAVAFAWAGSLNHSWRRIFLPLMAVLMAALPLVLMAGMLSNTWALEFAVMEVLGAAAIGVACLKGTPQPLPGPSTMWLTIGSTVVVIAAVGIAWAGGTSLESLLNVILLQPLRAAGLFAVPVTIGIGNDVWAALSLLAAVVILGPFARAAVLPPVSGLVQVFAGLLMWLSVLLLPSSTFLVGLPLAWMATQAPRDGEADSAGPYFRLFVPALVVLEGLQAYPVAGTQQSLAALGLVPMGAIILSDGIRRLRQANAARPALATLVAPAALLINIAAFCLFGLLAIASFTSASPLGLPGADSVRVPTPKGAQLRALVASIDRDCSSFITFPGMNSFYIWTSQEPPAELSAEVWWLELNDQEQRSVLLQLEGRQHLCVVKNQRVIDMWAAGRQIPKRPLIAFIDREFMSAGSYGDYELLVRMHEP